MAEEIATKEEKPTFDVESLTGLERTALLLLSLKEEDAASILKSLEPKEVQYVGQAMARFDDFTPAKVQAVLRCFLDDIQDLSSIGLNSEEFIRKALIEALGEDKASNIIDQIILGGSAKGLESLKWMDARQVANIIISEHPQIQTIVLSYLDPEQSAEILSQFPEKIRLDLMMRIANLEEVQPAALQELNDIMEKQFTGSGSTQAREIGGVKKVADIMNFMDGANETLIMDSLKETDEDLAQKIQDLMFVFDNLESVDDRGIQALLREISTDTLIVALKACEEAIKEKIFKNMSKRAAELMRDDLEAMGPVKLSEVETAQKEILTIARRMAEAGEIALGGSGEEMV